MSSKTVYLLLTLSAILSFVVSQGIPCKLRKAKYGNVCVCTSDYCDTLENVEPGDEGDYVVVTSSRDGYPFLVRRGKFSTPDTDDPADPSKKRTANVKVRRENEYQTVCGFGGAFTGSVSHILDALSLELRKHVYRSYYSGTQGIGYTMMRVSIGGSDFDLEPWAYNETPENDKALSNFTGLDPRDVKKVEQIRDLKETAELKDLKIIGAAWSPPRWMKSNNAWNGYSYLREDYYQTWADYHTKFLELMAAEELPLWAISTGNEPLNGIFGWVFVKFMSLGWTPAPQAKWVAEHLGPSIRKNAQIKDVKIFAGDDQRYVFPWWLQKMESSHANSIEYLAGFAVHWYWDQIIPPTLLNAVHSLYPDKLLLNTESCDGDKPFQTHGPELGSWKRAEKYILAYMEDFNHWVNGWIDWNLVLDERGGPNYVDNFVEAPVVVNTETKQEFYKQPIFYAIGHFSRFVVEGSVRIEVHSTNKNVHVIGFKRPENDSIVVIFYNKASDIITARFWDPERGSIILTLPPKSIHTLYYR